MTSTLVILAHPEPQSFNGAWAKASATAARKLGHDVLWSDLCAQGFDAVEGPRHFPEAGSPFDPLKAQESARYLPEDVTEEVAKLEAADRIVLHFPIWWFAPPAVLKGWCDRVLVHGHLHDIDTRFDTGRFRGKSVLFCVSTGATAAESGPDGKEGDLRLLLWPLAQTFRYLGAEVLEPVAVHGVHGYFEGVEKAELQKRLSGVLDGQKTLLGNWDTHPRLAFNPDTDFDEKGRLKPEATSHTPFIRHI